MTNRGWFEELEEIPKWILCFIQVSKCWFLLTVDLFLGSKTFPEYWQVMGQDNAACSWEPQCDQLLCGWWNHGATVTSFTRTAGSMSEVTYRVSLIFKWPIVLQVLVFYLNQIIYRVSPPQKIYTHTLNHYKSSTY